MYLHHTPLHVSVCPCCWHPKFFVQIKKCSWSSFSSNSSLKATHVMSSLPIAHVSKKHRYRWKLSIPCEIQHVSQKGHSNVRWNDLQLTPIESSRRFTESIKLIRTILGLSIDIARWRPLKSDASSCLLALNRLFWREKWNERLPLFWEFIFTE